MLRYVLILALVALAIPSYASVLTHLPATYMLASQLTKNTDIRVTYLPPKRYGLTRLPAWFARQGQAQIAKAAQQAQAVVSIGSVWPLDPIYPHVRAHNIRVVELDASRALTPKGSSVVTLQSRDGQTSPYIWLNSANLARMADILAADLKALYPQAKTAISQNQTRLKQAISRLAHQQQQQLFDANIDAVVLLDERLADFANANSLLVLARLTKPLVRWTTQEYAKLTALAEEEGRLVLLTASKVPAAFLQDQPNIKIIHLDSVDRLGTGIAQDDPLRRWRLSL